MWNVCNCGNPNPATARRIKSYKMRFFLIRESFNVKSVKDPIARCYKAVSKKLHLPKDVFFKFQNYFRITLGRCKQFVFCFICRISNSCVPWNGRKEMHFFFIWPLEPNDQHTIVYRSSVSHKWNMLYLKNFSSIAYLFIRNLFSEPTEDVFVKYTALGWYVFKMV